MAGRKEAEPTAPLTVDVDRPSPLPLDVQQAQVTPGLSPGLRYVKRADSKLPAARVLGPSPNPATNLAIADIALRATSLIARQAVERALLGRAYAPRKARQILRGRSMAQVLLHRSIAKVAMRSIPGALVVGGSLIAKTLYDRHKEHKAAASGAAKLAEMAEDGTQD
ncbi:MAG: hypothetical protein VYD90_07245 [Pseudomonadota bacterium]|nr:hypothetical protein [Pseudomonadota bacterium]